MNGINLGNRDQDSFLEHLREDIPSSISTRCKMERFANDNMNGQNQNLSSSEGENRYSPYNLDTRLLVGHIYLTMPFSDVGELEEVDRDIDFEATEN